MLTATTRLQIQCTALQHQQDSRKRRESSVFSLISGLPGLGCYHVPGAWTGLGPTAKLEVTDTPGRVPLVGDFKGLLTVCYVLAGTRVLHPSRPQGFESTFQLASTSPNAGHPNSSLVPKSAASWH